MNENHFSYFKVENFKRFESFEMDNIGQFNLIVGDNNVGKTSVLEALLFDEDLNKYANYLKYNLFTNKNQENNSSQYSYVRHYLRNLEKAGRLIFTYKNEIGQEYSVNYYLNDRKFTNFFSLELEHLYKYPKIELDACDISYYRGQAPPLIPANLSHGSDLVNIYSTEIQHSKKLKEDLINSLRVLITDIEGIDISTVIFASSQPTLLISRKNYDALIPLSNFGEGSIKLFRILIEIIKCKDKKLLIDEIETGIHYKRNRSFWKTIIKAAKENNVQLYATTHNSECLKFFRDVFLEDDMKGLQEKARVFRLVEHKDKQVSAYCYDFEAFDHAIENENELR